MRCHEADDKFTFYRIEPAEQLREVHSLVLAVGVHILPEQQYLTVTFAHKFPYFRYDLFRFAGAFPAAYFRHDAECAEVVAAVHDRHACLEPAVSPYGESLRDNAVAVGYTDSSAALLINRVQELRETVQDVRSEYQIDIREPLFHTLGDMFLLHHTSADGYHHIGIFLFECL